jgi:hypothetical protein
MEVFYMLKLKKIICTTLAAVALFTGSALTSAIDSDKNYSSPFISLEADAASERWGEYSEFRTTGWEPVRSSPSSTASIIGSYGSGRQVWGRRVYINEKETGYVAVAYWTGWTSKLGYVKAVKA